MSPFPVHLVRHAEAHPSGPGGERPLTALGQRQAAQLAEALDGRDVDALLCSPLLRCRQTLGPLGRLRHQQAIVDERLREGADPVALIELMLERARIGETVMCSHGDLIPEVMRLLERRGFELDGPASRCALASRWELVVESPTRGHAHYRPS